MSINIFSLSRFCNYKLTIPQVSMKKHNSSPSVSIRMWFYVILLWDQQRGRHYPKLLANAPYYLREKVNMCIYRDLLKDVSNTN